MFHRSHTHKDKREHREYEALDHSHEDLEKQKGQRHHIGQEETYDE